MDFSPEQLVGALALASVVGFCAFRRWVVGPRQFFDARRAETRAARSDARAHLSRGRPARVPRRAHASSAFRMSQERKAR